VAEERKPDLGKLIEAFPAEDIEWKVQTCRKRDDGSIWAIVVPYVQNRAIMERLDEVFGPLGWRNEFRAGPSGGVVCIISIHRPESGEWVAKEDGAENTDIEPVKGGLSGAMKRAAVQWGIGRYLYKLDAAFADVHKGGAYRGRTKDKEAFRWDPPALPENALPGGDVRKLKAALPSGVSQDEERAEEAGSNGGGHASATKTNGGAASQGSRSGDARNGGGSSGGEGDDPVTLTEGQRKALWAIFGSACEKAGVADYKGKERAIHAYCQIDSLTNLPKWRASALIDQLKRDEAEGFEETVRFIKQIGGEGAPVEKAAAKPEPDKEADGKPPTENMLKTLWAVWGSACEAASLLGESNRKTALEAQLGGPPRGQSRGIIQKLERDLRDDSIEGYARWRPQIRELAGLDREPGADDDGLPF